MKTAYKRPIAQFLTITVLTMAALFWLNIPHAKAAYTYSRLITIDHTKVPSNQALPVMVCANSTLGRGTCATVAGLNQSGGGAHVQNSLGYDIGFFTDATCTTKVTAWEVERYVASTGELIAWINDGTISSSVDTLIYLCYGDATISTFQSTASSVWNSHYKAVHHLTDGTTVSLTDSTSNANNGTNNGLTAVAGDFDGGVHSSSGGLNNNGYISGSSNIVTGTAITFSAWENISDTDGSGTFEKSNTSTWDWMFYTSLGSGKYACLLATANGTASITTSVAYGVRMEYLVATYDGSTVTCYVNGVNEGTSALTGNIQNGASSRVGWNDYIAGTANNNTGGTYDETRVSDDVHGPDWITAEYNNQSSPSTFYSTGAETTVSSGATTQYTRASIPFGNISIPFGRLIIPGN